MNALPAPGALRTQVSDLNDAGIAVGTAYTAGDGAPIDTWHATRWITR